MIADRLSMPKRERERKRERESSKRIANIFSLRERERERSLNKMKRTSVYQCKKCTKNHTSLPHTKLIK